MKQNKNEEISNKQGQLLQLLRLSVTLVFALEI